MQHDLVCIYVLEDLDQPRVFICYNGLVIRLDYFFTKDLKHYHRRIQNSVLGWLDLHQAMHVFYRRWRFQMEQ